MSCCENITPEKGPKKDGGGWIFSLNRPTFWHRCQCKLDREHMSRAMSHGVHPVSSCIPLSPAMADACARSSLLMTILFGRLQGLAHQAQTAALRESKAHSQAFVDQLRSHNLKRNERWSCLKTYSAISGVGERILRTAAVPKRHSSSSSLALLAALLPWVYPLLSAKRACCISPALVSLRKTKPRSWLEHPLS